MHNHIRYFSDLRGISCIAIVFLHSFFCAYLVYQPGIYGEMISLMVRDCMLWAVPCFVMVTGALLLNPARELTFSHIMHSYVRRAVVALVVFTFVFALFDEVTMIHGGFGSMMKNFALNLIANRSWLHMWYLYMLIGIYLCMPAFRLITTHADDKTIRYIVLILFLFQSVAVTVNFFLTDYPIGFYLPVYTVYPLYLFLGYALESGKIKVSNKWAWGMTIASTAVILLVIWGGIQYSNSSLIEMGSSYACAAVVFQSAGIFSLLKGTENSKDCFIHRFLGAVDRCSFGIYLMHVLFIYLIYRVFQFNPFTSYAGAKMLLVTVVAFICSWAVTWCLKHIPYIKEVI